MVRGARADALDWSEIRHFTPDEFDDPGYSGSWKHMDALTVLGLEQLRELTGWKIITHNKFGLRGCVCVEPTGHSDGSRHYVVSDCCDAVDWHFETDVSPRVQTMVVLRSGFTGIGVYYDWRWRKKLLPVGYHVDRRQAPQVWKREKGKYVYLLK
jgi:hypothetical protein